MAHCIDIVYHIILCIHNTDEIGRLDRLTFSQISSRSCSLRRLMSLQLEFIYLYNNIIRSLFLLSQRGNRIPPSTSRGLSVDRPANKI